MSPSRRDIYPVHGMQAPYSGMHAPSLDHACPLLRPCISPTSRCVPPNSSDACPVEKKLAPCSNEPIPRLRASFSVRDMPLRKRGSAFRDRADQPMLRRVDPSQPRPDEPLTGGRGPETASSCPRTGTVGTATRVAQRTIPVLSGACFTSPFPIDSPRPLHRRRRKKARTQSRDRRPPVPPRRPSKHLHNRSRRPPVRRRRRGRRSRGPIFVRPELQRL